MFEEKGAWRREFLKPVSWLWFSVFVIFSFSYVLVVTFTQRFSNVYIVGGAIKNE